MLWPTCPASVNCWYMNYCVLDAQVVKPLSAMLTNCGSLIELYREREDQIGMFCDNSGGFAYILAAHPDSYS